ncbi:MAG TPA: hypothetical protein VLZ33_00760, partial [Dysgonamonadaceae bacterium]|nr:hypothetical protein [Dysgonamonadaceae bacterium]
MRKTKASSLVISLICVFLTVIISNCTKENGKIEVEPDIDDEPDIEVKSVLDIAPPGQYVQGSEQRLNELNSFKAEDKLVATYYFYWYNVDTKAHIVNNDGTDALQDHPYIMEGFSYENVDWHKQELLDMIDAGIDIVLPVYWGDSRNYNSWSIIGLKRLVDACNALNSEGINPPKIGMFYDTSSLMTEGVLKEA